jgi:hypothetical protein
MELIIGMLGALVGVGLFVFGFVLGKQMFEAKPPVKTEDTDEEKNAFREERERLIQDQKAFRELMQYNSDMAYGLANNPLRAEKSG